MNKNDTMKAYWKNVRIIAETDKVCIKAARKYYKHIKRMFNERLHAESDEEHLCAEKSLDRIRLVMKRYSESLESKNERTIRR